jgi:SAM-dependent methyltransferase
MSQCCNCKGNHTTLVYSQDNVITYQNVLVNCYEKAKSVPQGKLDLHFCLDCTFLFNASFDENLVGYGISYENAQNHSKIFEKHIDKLIFRITQEKQINQHSILEIGCGNGYFLRKLIEANKNSGCGFDKSLGSNGSDDRLSLLGKYYDEQDAGDFDAVISRHVVEHILDNNSLISLLKRKNPSAQYFIETPSLEWIVNHNAFYDIFYEHCSYFSKKSLHFLFERHGICVDKIDAIFEGQYLWLESTANKKSPFNEIGLSLSDIERFFEEMENERITYIELISHQLKNKNIAIWGAGAKGVTFANFVDSTLEKIKCIIDINPNKCGKFLPGSGHPIVSPSVLLEQDIDVIIIMNPNYSTEIRKIASNKDYHFITVGEPIFEIS